MKEERSAVWDSQLHPIKPRVEHKSKGWGEDPLIAGGIFERPGNPLVGTHHCLATYC